MSQSVLSNSPLPLRRPALAPLAPDARPLPFWSLLLLALIAFGVYANSLQNTFALDDVAIVQGNQHVNNLDWTAIWSDNYWPKQDGVAPDILYRPVTIWSYLATRALAPEAAWAMHLGNILLHALVTIMASVLAWRLVANRPIALIAGLLFALHPLHSEVVANIVGRAELLSTAFSLAALLVFLPGTPLLLETAPAKRSYWHGWLVALCFFLALLCKETPVALLAGFLLIDLWRWANWKRNSTWSSRFDVSCNSTLPRWLLCQTARYYLPLLAFFAFYLALRINACGMVRDPHGTSALVNPLVNASLAERLITPFALLTKYLQLTIWPSVLCADYSFPSVLPIASPLAALPLIGILTAALALIAAINFRRKAPYILPTLVLFACSYAVVANFLPIGTIMGERLFYLPSLFVLLLIAAAAYRGYRAFTDCGNRRLRCTFAACLLLATGSALAARTVVRNTDWQDNITLAIASARDNPNSAKSCFWAGTVLVSNAAPAKWKPFGQELLHRSIELYPSYGEAYFELAKAQRLEQNLAQSVMYLAHAAQFGPGKSDLRSALDGSVADLKTYQADSYMPQLLAEQAAHPTEASPQLGLALAYLAQEKFEEAERACTAALALDGRFHEAACQLALINLQAGKREVAIDLLLQYVSHVRSNAGVRFTLVSAFLALDPARHPGALAKAEYFLREAQKLSPDDPRSRPLKAELTQKRAAQNTLTSTIRPTTPALAATGGHP